ncbi:MAG: sugar transferase [Oscillospiraceae bacterium]|nr:sugar transferase [Candidatus Equicaccousia limihippi]
MYRHFFKRAIDIVCALLALIVFCWLFGIVAILVKIKLGSPVLFKQVRPGKKDKNGSERLFKLCKFRTMTDQKDENGNLLPDSVRLTKFGAWLRNTSLDELPEAINILKGDMSVIGPRPLLVRDMVFMSADQRRRHDVRPGLSGLAQIRGRNTITWEGKLESDLEYIEHITFFGDAKIVLKTIGKFLKQEGITAEGEATARFRRLFAK